MREAGPGAACKNGDEKGGRDGESSPVFHVARVYRCSWLLLRRKPYRSFDFRQFPWFGKRDAGFNLSEVLRSPFFYVPHAGKKYRERTLFQY